SDLQQITDTIANGDLDFFNDLIASYRQQHDTAPETIAAALAKIAQQGKPLLLTPRAELPPEERTRSPKRDSREERGEKFREQGYGARKPRERDDAPPPSGSERFRVEVGHAHGVKPGNIMGAIANEGGLEGQYIGRIQIFDDHSLVDLPQGMPQEIFRDLQKARVAGQPLRISRIGGEASPEFDDGTPELPPFGGKVRAKQAAAREAHTAPGTIEKPQRAEKPAFEKRRDNPRSDKPRTGSKPGGSERKTGGKPPFAGKPRSDGKPATGKSSADRKGKTASGKPGEKPRFADKDKPVAPKKQRLGRNARLAAKGETPRARRPGTLTTRKKDD
ncbi:MAG: DbpA RNA binding domain-containing protein, partial [Proteobacteria bacterium]|nr:DbpA RNA binding domain-containing protein [Pseudomonadota bacterium]